MWDNVRGELEESPKGYLLFDDTVIDKRRSFVTELVRRQWSGNAKRVIKGIGVVTCVYVNPEREQFWLIDYRLYDPEGDGESKPDHAPEMLMNTVYSKQLLFSTVLMDSWYAVKELMLIERLGKVYYGPVKSNRKVDDSAAKHPYRRVDALVWTKQELKEGKRVKLRGFPKDPKVQLFRVTVSTLGEHRRCYAPSSADLTKRTLS